MSVQSPIYIMWGLMLPYPKPLDDDGAEDVRYDAFTDSAFKPNSVNGRHDTTILLDCMGCKYVAVGHVIARSGPYGDDLGTHTIPSMHTRTDPMADAVNLEMFAKWRKGIIETLREVKLEVASLGHTFGWHVIQHYR